MAGAVLSAHEREEIRVGIEVNESLSDIARLSASTEKETRADSHDAAPLAPTNHSWTTLSPRLVSSFVSVPFQGGQCRDERART
jgi:hypothetical protein